MKPTLLLIDDDEKFMKDFVLLRGREFECLTANRPRQALALIPEKSPDVVLLDLMLGEGIHGLDVLKEIQQLDQNLPVVIFTDFASVDTAVEAIKLGAADYLSKTASIKELQLVVEKALKQRLLAAQRQTLERELDRPYDEMIGASPAMQAVRQQMALFAATESTVLIIGESGVGKELVARQIYHMSPRKDKPFITVNCPAIPKDLLESDLFGHEKGAFTGAQARRIGKFELADDGTIFLDEIAELALEAQAKLLRVLQEKEFERIGGGTTLRTQARVIAATSRDLEEMVHRQQFREDLFYRLNVLPIRVPSLIDRKDDVPLLVNHFLKRTSVDINVPVKPLAPEAMALLTEYPWPGNVRELQNCMTRLVISTQHKDHIDQGTVAAMLGAARLVQMERTQVPQSWEEMDSLRTRAMQDAARDVERLFLEHLLQKFQGNVTKAAEHIGINRNSFHKLMRKCGMRAHPFKSKEEES